MKKDARARGPAKCRRKFLRYFKKALLAANQYSEIAAHAVRIESRTNLLFSFEKMALRDAAKSQPGAKLFAGGLYAYLHGPGTDEECFGNWCDAVASLPRRQTRVLTWPPVTVWGFIAQPQRHIFVKPNVTRRAAEAYGYDYLPIETFVAHLSRIARVRRKDPARQSRPASA